MDAKSISLTAVFASLYAVLLAYLAPFSFGPIQLRVADCLLPLAALFGWPVVGGATVGCLVGNIWGGMILFGGVNPVDVVLGSSANLLATSVIFALRKRRFLACVLGAVVIGVIVGGYLWLFFEPPDILGLAMPVWVAMILSVTASSLIAVALIGYGLLTVLSKPGMVASLKALGLRIYI